MVTESERARQPQHKDRPTGNSSTDDESGTNAIIRTTTTAIGIDLGTSNCTAAVWDSRRGHPKWMRLYPYAMPPLDKNVSSSSKPGRIIPSVVLLLTRKAAKQMLQREREYPSLLLPEQLTSVTSILNNNNTTNHQNEDTTTKGGIVAGADDDDDTEILALVGDPAQRILEQAYYSSSSSSSSTETSIETSTTSTTFSAEQISAAFISSAKRAILSEAAGGKPTFMDDDDWLATIGMTPVPSSLISSATNTRTNHNENDNLLTFDICPLGSPIPIRVTPVQVLAMLLQSIHSAAQDYLQNNLDKKGLQVPGGTWRVGQCVIGVPAHFDQTQRQQVLASAKLARIPSPALLTESTAAAMAYGLFVAPNNTAATTTIATDTNKRFKIILVLDMGGGTTDITIADMNADATTNGDNHGMDALIKEGRGTAADIPQFCVRATAGNPHLGGDDMDLALARWCVLDKTNQRGGKGGKMDIDMADHSSLSQYEQRQLLCNCKRAKEQLCGEDGDSPSAETVVSVQFRGKSYECTRDEFRQALEEGPSRFMAQLNELVELALDRYCAERNHGTTTTTNRQDLKLDEVILVGGGTRVWIIRDYLASKFPPPYPKELCTSVDAMVAVAQGTAIQAAINSQLVPLHEMQSAMMLDTVPHDIGVLIINEEMQQEQQKPKRKQPSPHDKDKEDDDDQNMDDPHTFVQLISRGTTLPATGSATFQLAHVRQPGVTVSAVERIESVNQDGGLFGSTFVNLGVFTFLLHQLTPTQLAQLENNKDNGGGSGTHRYVEIQMTLKETGEFVVGVIDENDPEQSQRRRRQRTRQRRSKRSKEDMTTMTKKKDLQQQQHERLGYNSARGENEEEGIPQEQILLIVACIALFFLYLGLKVLFQDELTNGTVVEEL